MPPASRHKPAVCPNCGRPLQAVTLDPDTPPWLCTLCSRGWWQAEVDAGTDWDPVARGFGHAHGDVLARCENERAAQHAALPSGSPVKTTARRRGRKAGG